MLASVCVCVCVCTFGQLHLLCNAGKSASKILPNIIVNARFCEWIGGGVLRQCRCGLCCHGSGSLWDGGFSARRMSSCVETHNVNKQSQA